MDMLRFYIDLDDMLEAGVSPLFVVLIIPLSVIIPLIIVKIVCSRKKYKCTECDSVFVPKFFQTHLAMYKDISVTERGRDQYCPKCQKITWCKYYDDNK